MCTHGDVLEIEITQKIKVDRCIANEIRWLNAQDVRTEGCCCGHGKYQPNAIIKPSSVNKAIVLGYQPVFDNSTGNWIITLKNGEAKMPHQD